MYKTGRDNYVRYKHVPVYGLLPVFTLRVNGMKSVKVRQIDTIEQDLYFASKI